uniref:Hemicentin-1 n=1 Tax=Magallana gigas TaxID=29159 RepID=K1PPW7_MAGGI
MGRGLWVAVLILGVMSQSINGGAPNNRGNEFIVGFMENQGTSIDVEIFVTTMRTVTVNVNVTAPRYSSSINEQFSVKAGEVKQLFFPPAIRPTGTQKVPNGIHVLADDDVVIYAVNKEKYSNDAYLGVPVDVLGKEYYAVTYYPPSQQCELLIVGVEDSTTVTIKFPAIMQQTVTWNGQTYAAGSTLTGTVDRFDTWQLTSKGDLTGAYITSDKNVGVISGNKKTKIGLGGSADHLCEMMSPVDGLKIGGTPFSTTYNTVTHNGVDYAAGYIHVSEGTHTVRHDSPIKVFGGYLYGRANYETYAFTTGTRLAPINEPCTPSASAVGDGIDNDCDGLIDEEACWDSNTDDDGDSRQDEDCATPPPVDGQWADWAQWTACSVTCFSTTGASNNGSRSRERTCTNPAPAYDGKQCVGDPTEVEACSITNVYCPVDGAWTSWENWGSCTVTCGSGSQSRARTCTDPSPQYGGADCAGDTSEFKQGCNPSVCPTASVNNYVQHCISGYFTCLNSTNKCIEESKKCDCNPDCSDGSDELASYAGCAQATLDYCLASLPAGAQGLAFSSAMVAFSALLALFLRLLN